MVARQASLEAAHKAWVLLLTLFIFLTLLGSVFWPIAVVGLSGVVVSAMALSSIKKNRSAKPNSSAHPVPAVGRHAAGTAPTVIPRATQSPQGQGRAHYSDEVKAQAVQMFTTLRPRYDSDNATLEAVAEKLHVGSGATVRNWVVKAGVLSGESMKPSIRRALDAVGFGTAGRTVTTSAGTYPALDFPGDPTAFEVSGENYHRNAFEYLMSAPGPDGQPRIDGTDFYSTAALVREPGNQFDSNAIRVEIEGHLIGYVPAEDASAFAPVLDRLATKNTVLVVPCRIWATRKNPQTVWAARVTIGLPDNPKAIAQAS